MYAYGGKSIRRKITGQRVSRPRSGIRGADSGTDGKSRDERDVGIKCGREYEQGKDKVAIF